jgi:Chaperone of endosialidase
MSDLNDLSRPVTTDSEPNVLDTLKAHIVRAATWSGWSATTNKVAGIMSAVTAATPGGRSLRLYRRNDANTTDEEVVSLPGISVGGNAGTASAAASGSALESAIAGKAPLNGAGATGTWNISISGLAANATTAAYTTRTGFGGGNIANNTANGESALGANTTGSQNTANGYRALYSNTTGSQNTANGSQSLYGNTTGYQNTANGSQSLYNINTGSFNTAYGVAALANISAGSFNTGVGHSALLNNTTNYSNTAGLGYNAQITGDNQVQLGDNRTTTYVFGTVQNRSDLRDKADVRDTELGLAFIEALRPVDYKWDLRDAYRPTAPVPHQLERPLDTDDPHYLQDLAAYEAAESLYRTQLAEWLVAVKPENLVRDGSHKGRRYHHGFIAQEVKEVLLQLDVDFGGYQDHKVNGWRRCFVDRLRRNDRAPDQSRARTFSTKQGAVSASGPA